MSARIKRTGFARIRNWWGSRRTGSGTRDIRKEDMQIESLKCPYINRN